MLSLCLEVRTTYKVCYKWGDVGYDTLLLLVKISVLWVAPGAKYLPSDLTQTPSQQIAREAVNKARLSPNVAVVPQFHQHAGAFPLMASHEPAEI